jgi:hypothetical protein
MVLMERHSLPGLVRLGMRRDFPPSGSGDSPPRLVVFKVINLGPVKGEVPWTRVIRDGAVRVGVDLAKLVIQVHAVDGEKRKPLTTLAPILDLSICA